MSQKTPIGALTPILLALAFCACSSSNGSTNSTEPTQEADNQSGTQNISNALFTSRAGSCAAYANEYSSAVVDVQTGQAFSGALTISVANDECTFITNAIPNHDFNDNGRFATPVSAQNDRYTITANPTHAASPTALVMGDDALFLNGVKLDLLAAACYGVGNEPLGREKIGCGPDQIDNPWRYDPMSPLNGFGTDDHNAHTQPDGTYHYHGNPMAMFTADCASADSPSPVIGFAADGFPIFGSCIAEGGTVRTAISSYVLKDNGGPRQAVSGYTTPVAGQGDIASGNYDGQFRGDYEFIAGAGDLDACNGMTVDGQYGYYITDSYPWGIGCYSGTPDASFIPGRP
ncbi:MAG: YHYH protein [Candidatus Latescibacteria bacterium]|nr:YHYH protein [Candidatus Latescibacterota bacterium]